MKRFVVVENPPKKKGAARSVPTFRPVVFPSAIRGSSAMRGSRNKGLMTRKQIESLPSRSCLVAARGRKFASPPRCRTHVEKKAVSAAVRAKRLASLAKARAVQADKRALTGYGSSVGAVRTNRCKRHKTNVGRSRTRAFIARNSRPISHSRLGSGSSARSGRGRTAKIGGRNMASAKQLAWRRKFASLSRAGLLKRKKGSHKRRARRNTQGKPLSGKVYRPSLPPRKAVRVVIGKFKKGWRKATKRKSRKSHKAAKRSHKKKAHKNPVYTVMNRKHKRLSSSHARAMSRKRWAKKGHRNRRRAHRNFGFGGIVSSLRQALSLKTVKSGLAVLAGAVAATGAPSLAGGWNVGWKGVGLSILAAALAAVGASFIAPQYLTEIASGGIVVVGLKLTAQFLPRALSWSPTGIAGFYRSGAALTGRTGVAGYLEAKGSSALVGRGKISGFARAAGEGFRSARV